MSKKADTTKGGGRKTATNRQLTLMDPDDIYFTHARVRPVFTGCNKRIQETLDEIVAGTTRVEDIPYITVIENFEAVVEAGPQSRVGGSKKGGGGGGKKKGGGRRRGDDSDDGDGDGPTGTAAGRGGSVPSGEAQPFYFSLNNRRLFLFKTLRSMGAVDKIPVQVKPALERERVKYTRDRCVLRAKLMGAGQRPVGTGTAEGDAEDAEDGEEEEDD